MPEERHCQPLICSWSAIYFHRQLDPLLFQIHAHDLYLDDVPDAHHLERMFDKAVADL